MQYIPTPQDGQVPHVSSLDTEDERYDKYWCNLYEACQGATRGISLVAFKRNPWKHLRAFGQGKYGDNHLPLLPAQERIRHKQTLLDDTELTLTH